MSLQSTYNSSSNTIDSLRSDKTENPEIVAKKIDQLCEIIIDEYEKNPNLQVCIYNLTILYDKFHHNNNINLFLFSRYYIDYNTFVGL